MIDWQSCPAAERDPDRVSGVWVFRGTRIPVATLFQNLEDGAQLADLVEWFPGVTIQQAREVLEHAAKSAKVALLRLLFDQGTPAPLRATSTRRGRRI